MSIDRSLPAVSDEIREVCHYRHMWDRVDSNHWTAHVGDPLTLRCMRCGTEFRAQINPNTGEYMRQPDYVYPPGYQYRGEQRRLTPSERRAWIVQQSIFNIRKTRSDRRAS